MKTRYTRYKFKTQLNRTRYTNVTSTLQNQKHVTILRINFLVMKKEDANLHLFNKDMELMKKLESIGVTTTYGAHLLFSAENPPAKIICFDIKKGKLAVAENYEQARRFFL